MLTLDWNKYLDTARKTAAEGTVLLRNKKHTLPYLPGTHISVFGRIQLHYYKSGTGSDGMVNVSKTIGILEALEASSRVTVNKELVECYRQWEENHPFDEGMGWGNEPWSQEEMPLTDEIVECAARQSDTALIIIGRTAGEDKDNACLPGSYLLTDLEKDMLKKVREHFKTVTVLLNTGNIIDMKFIKNYNPDAVVYAWQGGMVGGLGTVDVLTGNVSPSGKLADTIAVDAISYPSTENFGDPLKNVYAEDIYVGYRYFETVAKNKVMYPFGFGLSYTTFEICKCTSGQAWKAIKTACCL